MVSLISNRERKFDSLYEFDVISKKRAKLILIMILVHRQDCKLELGNGGIVFPSLHQPWLLFAVLFTSFAFWLDMTPFMKYASCQRLLFRIFKVCSFNVIHLLR